MVTVVFPPQFQKMLNGELKQHGDGVNLAEVLRSICATRAELQKILFLPNGDVSPFLAFSVMGGDCIYPSMLTGSIALRAGDAVEVILSMAGG
jgi:hypothetical protein